MIEYLNALPPDQESKLNRYNFSLPHTFQDYPENRRGEIAQAVMEACAEPSTFKMAP